MRKIKTFLSMTMSRKLQLFSMIKDKFITKLIYNLRLKSCGLNCLIMKPLFWTPEFICLGNNITIWKQSRIEGIDSYHNEKFHPVLFIGENSSIQQSCHITFCNELNIGREVTILHNVLITDIDHEYNNIDENISNQPIKHQKTEIGDFCFIGAGAKIQAGTILGKQCIVGTNAVVRGDFPDYSVIVGVPGRIIKRFDMEKEIWRKTNSKGEFI